MDSISSSVASAEKLNRFGKDNSSLAGFVNSNAFEATSAALIICLIVVMCAQIQYHGLSSGYELNMAGYARPGGEVWPSAARTFQILDMVFNALFTIELVLRVVVLRTKALKRPSVCLDFLLVITSWIDFFGFMALGIDPFILRLVRLLRLLRFLKFFSAVQFMETLFVLVKSIQSSVGALLWSFALIAMIQLVVGIALCQVLMDVINDETKPIAVRRQIFEYFGTVMNSILTMFEICLGNWVVSCRLLYENVSVWYGVFYILYRCCFMFAIIKVITAVFIAETTKSAANDSDLALMRHRKETNAFSAKLRRIFTKLDDSGDGLVTWAEFSPVLSDVHLQTYLRTLGIETHDLEHLFEALQSGDGTLDVNTFIESFSKVKGPAKSIDVLKLQTMAANMDKKVDSHFRNLKILEGKLERAAAMYGTQTNRPVPAMLNDMQHI